MVSRIIPLALLLLTSILGNAQTPQSILVQPSTGTPTLGALKMACPDQFAGTISFANFTGQSNDIDLDTIYFCFGDEIDIIGNGDADLTGDPNPLTAPGITYGFYNCEPTIAGPNFTTIITDPCLIPNPSVDAEFFVTEGGQANGDILFSNSGQIQTAFGGGNPILIWFAPLTVDAFGDKTQENDPITGEEGPCMNVNTDAAFAVVYLNEIQASNINVNANPGGCLGSFDIAGGLPEFDGSDYNISIQLLTDPTVTGTIMAPGGVTHGDMVTFSVPQPGQYSVSILDEKSCPETFLMDFSACQVLEMEISSATVGAGGNVCVDVTVLGGFTNILALGWSINFDETVLDFTGAQNFNPNLSALGGSSLNQPMSQPGSIIFTWNSPNIGENLPNGSLLYQLCFDAIGLPGNCSAIEITNNPSPGPPQPIEVILDDAALSQIGFDVVNGQICLDGATIALDFMQTPVTCPADANGNFTVNINGGTAPYQLSWQAVGGGSTQGPININNTSFTTPMNQAAGCYSVTVTDATSAVVDTVCVESPAGINILLDENPPLCAGQNGTIVATIVTLVDTTIVTDLTGYTFLWSNGSVNPSSGPVPSGIYSVTVTEPNGCTEANSTTLTDPNPLNVNVNITPASCSGVDDGAISISISGGTPDANNDYLIEWPTIGGGLTFMNNVSNVTGLEADCYPLMITDDNGCIFVDTICVDADKVLLVNAIVQDILCEGTNTGNIFATASPGAPNTYTFNWTGNPPAPVPTNTATTTQLSNLGVGANGMGNYTLTMTDQDGCNIDTTFTINEPAALDATLLSFTPESCNVGGDGTATLGVTGGVYPYSYDWGAGITNDSVMTNLSAGLYVVSVMDANLCEDTVQVTIAQPVPPVITMFEDDTVNCPTSTDGILTVVVDNPANVMSYTWSPNVSTSDIANGLGVGTYFVTVTGNNGCETVDTAMVLAPEPLVLDSVTTMSPICPGDGNGQMTIFVSGGTAPYFFDWPTELDIFDGVGNATAGGSIVSAGTYIVTVQDANLCEEIEVTVTLEDPPSIVVDFSAIDSVSCFISGGFCDGGATATAMYSDGTTGLFNFTWESGEADNGVMFSTADQLCRGLQGVTVSDGICSAIDSVLVPSPAPLTGGSFLIENTSCFGETDGSISVQATGGTAPYTYMWNTNETGPMISNLAPGEYLVSIEDINGCSTTISFDVEEPDPLILLVEEINNISCNGFDNGNFTVTFQGGTTILNDKPTYTWSNGIAPVGAGSATNLAAGTYSVTGTDDNGCQAELTFEITEPDPIEFVIGDFEPISCFNESTFVTVESATAGPNSIFTFEVDNFGEAPLGTLFPVFAGEHTITVNDKSILGCFIDTTIIINEPAPISVNFSPNVDEIELGDSLYQLNPIISASTQIDSFLWSPTTGLLCPNDTFNIVNCPNPLANITESMTYTLTIIDENGCRASDEIFLDVDANRNVFIPNIFSPNDDGRNDIFRIYTGLGVDKINSFRIFNRWGATVFEINDPDVILPSADGTIGWDGRFNGERLNPDVYVYMIEVTFLDGKELLYRGDVTLLR